MFFCHHLSVIQCLCNSRKKFILTSNHTNYKGYQIPDGLVVMVLLTLCVALLMLGTLSAIVNGCNGVNSAKARGLLLQVSSFQFVLCLVIFDRILSCTKSLSDMLQSTQLI